MCRKESGICEERLNFIHVVRLRIRKTRSTPFDYSWEFCGFRFPHSLSFPLSLSSIFNSLYAVRSDVTRVTGSICKEIATSVSKRKYDTLLPFFSPSLRHFFVPSFSFFSFFDARRISLFEGDGY